MKLAIMFCNTPEIEIQDVPESIEDMEAYIHDVLGYKTSELSWQCYDKEVMVRFV